MLSTFVKLPVVIKTFVLSIFEWRFYTGFTVYTVKHLKTNTPWDQGIRSFRQCVVC